MQKSFSLGLLFLVVAIGFFAYWQFLRSQKVAGVQTEIPARPVRGIILPHHDLAREIVISSLSRLAGQSVTRIVIFSPNHFRPQSYTFTSAEVLQDFPIDTGAVNRLRQQDSQLVIDSGLLAGEHGLTIPMTYLSHQFPQAKFIPLAVSPYFDPENLSRMADTLLPLLSPDTLIVSSIDFSHENMPLQAMRFNTQTTSAISGFEYDRLYKFTDDNLDSPASAALLMRLMERLGSTSWELWHNTHGSALVGDPLLQGTSYVIGTFR